MSKSEEDLSLLNFSRILSEKDAANSDTLYHAYVKMVPDENPFFPMKEGLRGDIDLAKVQRTFKNARFIYTNIIEKDEKDEKSWQPARLYKLNGAGEAVVIFKKMLLEKIDEFKNKSPEEILPRIQEMIDSEDRVVKTVGQTLYSKQIELSKVLQQPNLQENRNKLNALIKNMGEELKEVVSKSFFKTQISKEYLQDISSVYKPGEDHSWGANLAWMLAHIRKGNSFIVCSNILAHQYRRGDVYANTIPSAFAREICIALKAGYALEKNEDGSVQLKPSLISPENLKNLDTNGTLGSGINPTYEEINEVYAILEKIQFDKQKNCKCAFQFENGRVAFRTANTTFDYDKFNFLEAHLIKGYNAYKAKNGEPADTAALRFKFTRDKFSEGDVESLLSELLKKEDIVIKNDEPAPGQVSVIIRASALKKISNNEQEPVLEVKDSRGPSSASSDLKYANKVEKKSSNNSSQSFREAMAQRRKEFEAQRKPAATASTRTDMAPLEMDAGTSKKMLSMPSSQIENASTASETLPSFIPPGVVVAPIASAIVPQVSSPEDLSSLFSQLTQQSSSGTDMPSASGSDIIPSSELSGFTSTKQATPSLPGVAQNTAAPPPDKEEEKAKTPKPPD